MATEIAKAYVQIIPSAEGVSGELSNVLGGEAEKAGQDSGKKFTSGFGSVLGGVGKVAAGAAAAGTAAVAGMVKSAVSSFADYEQLVGGVETLFKDAAGDVMANANEAFQTAGLSANDYMETVTSFSASLLQSLGGDTKEAASVANQAIVDMADNANKMGSSMESIQTAYQGFAKQNYTMLDNLKLGYGGTKSEMQRLLDDASKLSGIDFNIDSYSDIISAIHVIQTEMGITGTTAAEASETISGSLAATKASWANLMTAIGTGDSNAISDAINNLVESASTLGSNIMPVVQQALMGVSQLIEQLAPQIASAIPELLNSVLPGLLSAGVSVVQSLADGIVSAIPSLMPAVTDTIIQLSEMFIGLLPQLIEVGVQVLVELANGIAEALPDLVPIIVDVVAKIVETLIDNIPLLLDAAIQLILGLADGLINAIPVLIEHIPTIITALVEALVEAVPMLIDGAIQLVTSIVQALPDIIQALIDALPQIIEAIVAALPELVPALIEGAVQLVIALVAALPEIIQALIDAIPQIIEAIVQAFVALGPALVETFSAVFDSLSPVFDSLATYASQAWSSIQQAFKDVGSWFKGKFDDAVKGVKDAWNNIKEFFSGIWESIKEVFAKAIEDFTSIGSNIVAGIKNGITSGWKGLSDWFSGKINSLKDKAKDLLDIESPSKVFADEVGRWIPAGIAVGIEQGMPVLNKAIDDMTGDMLADSVSTTYDSINSVNYTPASPVDTGNNKAIQLLSEYLPIIAQGMNVDVNIRQNEKGTFEMVRNANNKLKIATGYHALA